MPYPYLAIPSVTTWQSDSYAFFAIRTNDPVLLNIDSLLAAYHDPNLNHLQQETLFFLRSAIDFWIRKVDRKPKNTAPTGLNSTNLPTTKKFNGSTSRNDAVQALGAIVDSTLAGLLGVHVGGLQNALMNSYGTDNRELANDQLWLSKYPDLSVYLTTAGTQRMYKLRFRGGVAWRWNGGTNNYTIFDSTDNSESEINDKMVHFVMDQRGRIFAGFDKNVVWFKHSSLVGGVNALSAGRMKVEQGVPTLIENDSGHYAPNHQHMRNLLQRLRLYGTDLTGTKVRRLSDKVVFKASDILANDALAWPDGGTGW